MQQVRELAKESGRPLVDVLTQANWTLQQTGIMATDTAGFLIPLRSNLGLVGTTADEMRQKLEDGIRGITTVMREQGAEAVVNASQGLWDPALGMALEAGRRSAHGFVSSYAEATISALNGFWTGTYGAAAAPPPEVPEKAGESFAFDLAGGVRKGIKKSQPELQGALLQLRAMLHFSWASEAGYALGDDFGKAITKGLKSKEPEVQGQAQELALGGLEAIDKAGRSGPRAAERIGELLAGLYGSGMSRGKVEATLQAQGVSLSALEAIASKKGWHHAGGAAAGAWVKGVESQTKPAGTAGASLNDAAQGKANDTTGWRTGGANVAGAWKAGFLATLDTVPQAANTRLGALRRQFVGESPPPEGPLSTIDAGGRNVGLAWKYGFLGGMAITPADVARPTAALGSRTALGPASGPTVSPLASMTPGREITGYSLSAPAAGAQLVEGTIRHEHRVALEISPASAQALRDAGYDEARIASVATRQLGELVGGAAAQGHHTYLTPRRS
ncbi:MAG: hypothetical protein U0869_25465 [Chloroflexota bacterium]